MVLGLHKKKAKERELAGKASENSSEGKGETKEKVAGFVGVNYKTLSKAEEIVKAAE